MAVLTKKKSKPVEYPTSDGKPMAETDFHYDQLVNTRETLDARFADDPMIYVTGNLLLYYVRGDKRRHVSPDVFVVKGVPKRKRLYYLTWEEGKNPNAVIEITSKSTRKEDTDKKYTLYRDVLKVREYFLFDPFGDYLKPVRLRGHRLVKGEYQEIAPVDGRLPSQVLALHLERAGNDLRLYDPETQMWLPTPIERIEDGEIRANREKQRADRAELRNAELSKEIERLRGRLESNKNGH